jgi:hypothetical protein
LRRYRGYDLPRELVSWQDDHMIFFLSKNESLGRVFEVVVLGLSSALLYALPSVSVDRVNTEARMSGGRLFQPTFIQTAAPRMQCF